MEAHEVFHIFVAAAATVHWIAIYRIAKLPIASKITFHITEFPDVFIARALDENIRLSSGSMNELKEIISNWIEENFLPMHRPQEVRFKYFKEEVEVISN